MYICVQERDFDVGKEQQLLKENAPRSGAHVLFVGLVRDFNSAASSSSSQTETSVEAIELSHYSGMTERAIEEVCQQAQQRWPLEEIRVIHRIGRLQAQDQIVLVAVAASHRADAFSGADFIMDELKTNATFWKKEIRQDGEHWLDMKESDRQRSARWRSDAN